MEIVAHDQQSTLQPSERSEPHSKSEEYRAGFHTDVETDEVPKGLSADTVRLISEKEERARLHARLPPARP